MFFNYALLAALAFLIAGLLTGCTGEEGALRHQLIDVKNDLYACSSKLEQYELRDLGRNQDLSPIQSEPEQPSEPEYEEVDVYVVDGTKCYASEGQGEAPACGRGFWKCNDGKIRECMVNVKYEIKTERKLVEQE